MEKIFTIYGKREKVHTWKTRDRLAFYRNQAADARNQNPDSTKWRYWKRRIFDAPNNARGERGEIFTDSVDQYGEYLGDVETLAREHFRNWRDFGGWYADNYQHAVITGGVAKLRSPRGTFYIPVTHCNQWDGTIHYLGDAEAVPKGETEAAHIVAIRDAISAANGLAESEADRAREANAQDMAEQDISEAREHIHTLNREALTLIKAIKAEGRNFAAPICSALADKVRAILADRAEQFRIIEERGDNFWSAVEG